MDLFDVTTKEIKFLGWSKGNVTSLLSEQSWNLNPSRNYFIKPWDATSSRSSNSSSGSSTKNGGGSVNGLWKQNHYREVPRWEIFMEQELRFVLDFRPNGRLSCLYSFKTILLYLKWNDKICGTFFLVPLLRDTSPLDFSIMTLPAGWCRSNRWFSRFMIF